MNTPAIVSPEVWEAARLQLLVKEKELTRARDVLAAERRRMPWVAVEKEYEFEGPGGKASLVDLPGVGRRCEFGDVSSMGATPTEPRRQS